MPSTYATRTCFPSRGQRVIALVMLALLVAGALARQGFAADSAKTITLGESLSESERAELLDYFGAKDTDNIEIVTVDDTKKAMAGVVTDFSISLAVSSTSLTCRDLGQGLTVKTHNINAITPSMYAIALVTAGIGDAELLVAAPDDGPAGGMTALTGVFKTWDIAPCDSGSTTKKRQQLALEELTLTE